MKSNKRFIEESFPVKEVSQESAREKNIRHGHISTLHMWWARRPLASSRATNYAALIPASENIDEWDKKRQFIIDLCKWENSLRQDLIDKARRDILKANGGKPPKVLDPFGGGGAIPLEALRLGCEVYSNDYNPVAVLIQKCTLEYPQKYGKPGEIEREFEEFGKKVKRKVKVENILLEDVKKWGNWVLEKAKKEIGRFYPEDEDGSIPVGYIWARTIPCQNPSCGAEIPLMRQFWLAKRAKKKVTLYPYIDKKVLKFRIVGDGYKKILKDFDPEKGTIKRTVATCLVCGSVVDDDTTKKLFQEKKIGQRLVAVVLSKKGKRGKRYRIPDKRDVLVYQEAKKYLEEQKAKFMLDLGMQPLPDEPMNTEDPTTVAGRGYGFSIWGELFNSRQTLALITFVNKIRKIPDKLNDDEYSKIIMTYLGFVLDRLASFSTSFCRWKSGTEQNIPAFSGRNALPMVTDYFEVNTIGKISTGWDSCVNAVIEPFGNLENFYCSASVSQMSVTCLSFPDNFFDAVFTDPPYYDNVNYAELSDFFYVWLKRTIGELYPELFSTPLSPKSSEIVVNSTRQGGKDKANKFFEDMLKKAFGEIHRVLRHNGLATIVYAHKSTEGWETLINSLLDSGLVMTGAWPIHTEMSARLNANETAALASSIYIVARKMKRQPTGFYNEVKQGLEKYLNDKLEQLWKEGIGGADFFIAAIGSAIEVFGKYEKVLDYEGNIVRADRLLADVRKISTNYAVRQILHNGFAGDISGLTRFYVLWRWEYGAAKVHFDEARKLAASCAIDLAQEWDKNGFIKKEKEFIRVLGPQDRIMNELKNSHDILDVLHQVLLLWEKSRRDEIIKILNDTGYGQNEAFFRVAQAISETLPNDSKEKKLLDGFLTGKDRLKEETREKPEQKRFSL
ncbi:MAG: DUF1156 domain-containing protein [Candidatus Scalinduaceae bacterium]